MNGLAITSNNAAKVEGDGTAGTAAGGVLTVQGVASMTPVQTSLNSTPSLANGNGVVPTQGGNVLSATNGDYANVLQGNAVLSATNGLYANILQEQCGTECQQSDLYDIDAGRRWSGRLSGRRDAAYRIGYRHDGGDDCHACWDIGQIHLHLRLFDSGKCNGCGHCCDRHGDRSGHSYLVIDSCG